MDEINRNLLPVFNHSVDAQDLRREWEEWHRAFELMLELKNVESQHRKLVMLLTCGGRDLQRIFYNLRPTPDEIYPEAVKVPLAPIEVPEYDNAVKRLSKFFIGKRNERVELELFRSLKQDCDESFNQFILRLRAQAARCEFLEREEKELLQQVTMGARDERVRDKGLEDVMGLDDLINYAINREVLLKQKAKNKPFNESSSSIVGALREKKPSPTSYGKQAPNRIGVRRQHETYHRSVECNRCGSRRHRSEADCYARKARCNTCGKIGHFSRKCKSGSNIQIRNARYSRNRTPMETNTLQNSPTWKEELPNRPKLDDIAEVKVHVPNDGTITCKIDTLPVVFLIDSGAAINTVTESIWNELIDSKAIIHKKKFQCDRQFTAYASNRPLRVMALFEGWISVSDDKPKNYAEFFVIEGASKSLLSKATAEELKVLKVGLEVQNVEVSQPFPKFPNMQVKLSIDKTITPRKLAYLRVPEPMKEKVDKKIVEMLSNDIIERAVGPPDWISPMVVVPKGRDDIRLCINMKFPNEAIQREHYPLPVIETFLNKLRGATWFSKLDITSAFHHIELHPDSRGITTFMTDRGLMRFKRLMFGINCAPEIFQRIMTEMLAGIDGVIVYLDDIVVAGQTREDHDLRLKQVLSVLKENNAKLNTSKCLIGVNELEILGFKVSATGISPSDDKVLAIRNFRKPETKEQVRSFLGLVNFVGHFIPMLSTRTEPLRQFIRGDVATFGKEQKDAFDDLREELSKNVRKLGFFDPKDTTQLFVDASPVGLGAVLVQRDTSEIPRIVSFASKGLTASERVYPQTQREALAVVWAVERFYLYLFGIKFTIFTDHKTLEYIYGGNHRESKRACTRAEGWALRLQPYDFEIKHIPGSTNISDILSRLCCQEDKPFDDNAEHYLCAIGEGPVAITLDEIRQATKQDEILEAVSQSLETDEWQTQLIHYQAFKKELGNVGGIIVRDDRIVLPTILRHRALDIAHRGHPGVVTMRRYLREKVWWPYMDRDIVEKIQECAGCASVSSQGPPEPMHRKEMPERAWQDIAIDFFSAKECATFLVVVDYFSRFIKVIEMKTTTAAKTIEALEKRRVL
ncbi:uncharacterized protein K02A2.6-like [Topomyia yanbarensis]|uniref:uncharacterized protein K02A2.6-like n=1 Tax=Topomyia yanbarensis TaxID=2498891 RepID=UPI00273AF298|nr:uncharacterized protein K02A2.6-like [Topomyia yanbarensis]